ncbi:unnamed protein product [Notodromas monacha]|uniref:Uncharacterized protein n=1 Tax=Notodromas monacha TaxID=399045 RepID=A0A7R9GHD4_9CRUS|nr:unnamed protein product [Notodromas monacha]CAG0921346.1 unnamed protein product [Notodromas monacha]
MSSSMLTSPSPGSECDEPRDQRLTNGDAVASEEEIVAEARYLKEHRGRLEARMKFLEDQNSLLEMQMHRLKGVLDQPLLYPGSNYPNMSKSGTLQSRHVTASQLATDSPHGMNGTSAGDTRRIGLMEDDFRAGEVMDILSRRPDPPPHSSELANNGSKSKEGGGSVEDLFSKCGDVGKAVESLVSALRTDDLDS